MADPYQLAVRLRLRGMVPSVPDAMPRLGPPDASSAGTPGAIIVPACNEAARIEACLRALLPQAGAAACPVMVVVNATQDDTARRAARCLAAAGPGAGVVVDFGAAALPGGVGQSRAIGFDLARRHWGAARLMTTDADCLPDAGWVATQLATLAGVDVAFGAIAPIASELAALHPALARHGTVEARYMQAAVELAALLDPCPVNPAPAHRTAGGANMAFRAEVLDRIGGFPARATNEDRAFARAAERQDLRIRYCGEAVVRASCRLQGRAPGGMAETLRARCDAADPFCDDWLEPAAPFALRHGLRGRLRAAWPDPARLAAILRGIGAALPPGLEVEAAGGTGAPFGAFWQDLEARLPVLARRRLRHSEAARELPRLRALLEAARCETRCAAGHEPGREVERVAPGRVA
jgi:GT2 family glycosyltransferase